MRKSKSDHLVPIQSLFDKYRKVLVAPQRSVEVAAEKVIRQVLVLPDQVPLKVGYQPNIKTLYIKTTLIKPLVLKKKNLILRELQNSLGAKSAPVDVL